MKKMILCVALSSGALFAAEPSSSSHQPDSSNFNGPFVDLSNINATLKGLKPFFENPKVELNINRNDSITQTVRSEKGSYLEQAAETAVHVSAQTLFSLLVHDLYSGGKNFLFPNEEAAFQESVANLKLLQAQNAEKEREVGIQMAQANVKIIEEFRELISTVRKLNAEATKRNLTPEEADELNSAQENLTMLRSIMNAAAA